jgi:hypothetical protein
MRNKIKISRALSNFTTALLLSKPNIPQVTKNNLKNLYFLLQTKLLSSKHCKSQQTSKTTNMHASGGGSDWEGGAFCTKEKLT